MKTAIDLSVHEDVTCVRVNLATDRRSASVYVFLTDGMLVDTGCASAERDLAAFFKEHARAIDQVVLTHSHEDHVGTAAWIERHLNVPLSIHPAGVAFCASWPEYPKYRQAVWGIRKPFTAQPLGEQAASRSRLWKVIYTPGHAEDHVVLLDEERGRLFSGDLFLSPKTRVIMRQESVPTIIDSLRKVLQHDFQSMYCCHAGYLPDGKRMLAMKLEELENLSGEILHLYGRGLTIEEINAKLFPESLAIIEVSGGEFDSIHIVRTVVREMAEQAGQGV